MRPKGDEMKKTGKSVVLATAVLEEDESVKKATKNQSKLKFQEKDPKSKKS